VTEPYTPPDETGAEQEAAVVTSPSYVQLTQQRVRLGRVAEAFTTPDDAGRYPIIVLVKSGGRFQAEVILVAAAVAVAAVLLPVGPVLTIAGLVLAVALAIASPFVAIVLAKWRRRRLRRRAATAVERIEGGWQEFTDTAADYGYPIAPTATRAEQAATVGGLGPLVLAAVVDRAVFAPDGPADGDDDHVWTSVDELQRRLAEPRRWRERARAAISLGSLGGYAGSRKGAGS
jgi:hypothetical protein